MPAQPESTLKPTQRRRRGKALKSAIYEAALSELDAVGYGRLTVEGIATRAHTGKAALYRRWSNKHDLVQDALRYAMPPLPEPRTDRSVRQNLLAQFTAHRDVLAGKTSFPGLAIVGELLHEPELRAIFADAVMWPRIKVVEAILQEGVRSGEIDPNALTPLTPRIGPALINHHMQLTGEPPTRQVLLTIVDTAIPAQPD